MQEILLDAFELKSAVVLTILLIGVHECFALREIKDKELPIMILLLAWHYDRKSFNRVSFLHHSPNVH